MSQRSKNLGLFHPCQCFWYLLTHRQCFKYKKKLKNLYNILIVNVFNIFWHTVVPSNFSAQLQMVVLAFSEMQQHLGLRKSRCNSKCSILLTAPWQPLLHKLTSITTNIFMFYDFFMCFFIFLKTYFLVLTLKISIFKTQSAFQGNWIVKKSCTGKWIFYSCCLNSAYFVLTRIFNEKEQFANCWNAAVLHLTRPRSIVGKEGFCYWSGRWSFMYGLFQPPQIFFNKFHTFKYFPEFFVFSPNFSNKNGGTSFLSSHFCRTMPRRWLLIWPNKDICFK